MYYHLTRSTEPGEVGEHLERLARSVARKATGVPQDRRTDLIQDLVTDAWDYWRTAKYEMMCYAKQQNDEPVPAITTVVVQRMRYRSIRWYYDAIVPGAFSMSEATAKSLLATGTINKSTALSLDTPYGDSECETIGDRLVTALDETPSHNVSTSVDSFLAKLEELIVDAATECVGDARQWWKTTAELAGVDLDDSPTFHALWSLPLRQQEILLTVMWTLPESSACILLGMDEWQYARAVSAAKDGLRHALSMEPTSLPPSPNGFFSTIYSVQLELFSSGVSQTVLEQFRSESITRLTPTQTLTMSQEAHTASEMVVR